MSIFNSFIGPPAEGCFVEVGIWNQPDITVSVAFLAPKSCNEHAEDARYQWC